MKADPEQQRRLLDLQEIDTEVRRLAHRARTLPAHEEIRELDTRLTDLRAALDAVDTELGDLDREQRKAEADVDQVRARSERDQKRLDSGQVSSPKDLESLQSEIASLRRRQDELEEIVLEIMERREAAESRRAKAAAELEDTEKRRADAEDARASALVDIRADEDNAAQRRTRVAAEIPADLLALYDKLRDSHGGVGAAALRQGRCEGCKLALSTVELSEIRTAPPDQVLRCEECRRILVRTTESGL